jgi:ligand-binding sensor domain-containing protein/two-component sensor histidine kinase
MVQIFFTKKMRTLIKSNKVKTTSLYSTVAKVMLVMLLLFGNLLAQEEEISFTHFTAEDGLSTNIVSKIIQDKNGFIWIGTRNGLNRFDGYNFKVFFPDPSNKNTISGRVISCLCEDKFGNIWIGTPTGLSVYDWRAEKFYQYKHDSNDPSSLSHDYICAIIEDKFGTLWIATMNGLNKYNREKNNFTGFKKVSDRLNPDSLNRVTNLIEDEKNNLWLATWNGFSYVDKNCKIIKQFFSQPANSKELEFRFATYLYRDKENNIWIGTYGGGIKKYISKTGQFKEYVNIPNNFNSLSNNNILSIYQDNQKNIWIGTLYGLNKYLPKTDSFERIVHDPRKSYSLISDIVYDISQDKTGLIWVATTGGVSRFFLPRSKFKYITENYSPSLKGLTSNSIMGLFIDKNDNIWLGSYSGVEIIDAAGNRIAHLKKDGNPNSLSNNLVRKIFVDSKGIVWIGTNNDGLNRYDPSTGKFRVYTYDTKNPNSISNNGITSICEDSFGSLWFGTRLGLNRFDRKTEKFYRYFPNPNDPNSLRNEAIRTVYADSHGFIWIGTDRGGLSLLDIKSNRFTHFTNDLINKYFISSNCIYTIFRSKDGMMWIGTNDGLDLINPQTKSIKIYLKKDGLPSNIINAIQEDNDGNLWIATDKGISQMDKKTGHFTNYNKRSGLRSLEFVYDISGKTKDGTIYFGSEGLMHFNPKNVKDEYPSSPIVFTDLKIYNETVPVIKNGILEESITAAKIIKIPKDRDVITFEFALLDYFDVKRNTFRYKLMGYDVDWNQIGSRNLATYTNLPPGEFTFVVRATNNNGVKNEKEVSIRVIIVPAFYQTWWFKLVLVIIFIMAAFLIITERTKKIIRQNKILENSVAERTKDLDKTISELNQEIIERKKAESKVQASLDEKEVMLKEIHHRVKNNLQVISSLLYLQSFSLKDVETLNLFEDSQNRIKSMALIHEKLYQSKNLAEINFGEYVDSLIEHLARSLNRNGMPVKIKTNINNVILSLDNAISCGLIVNEVITNAYKYAFPLEWVKQKTDTADNIVEIRIELLEDNKYVLTMFDNGIGLPKDLDIDKTESLGLKIVKSMVQQINGSLDVQRNGGTKFIITFID